MEAEDGKRIRIGKGNDKKFKEDLPVESQGSEWSPLLNLALDLTSVLGLKVLTALDSI